MKIKLPSRHLLYKTNDVDYFYWNYQFPIKYIQIYRFKSIVRLLNEKIYNNLLEFGTGSGIFLLELSIHCRNLYAIDIHQEIEHVQSLCHYLKIAAEVTKQSIEKTDFPDNYFDAIVGVSVLDFVPDLQSAINEIERILKPEGIFVTICPQKNIISDFILSLLINKSPDKEFSNSRNKLSLLLEKSFNVIDKITFPPLLYRFTPVYNVYKLSKKSS